MTWIHEEGTTLEVLGPREVTLPWCTSPIGTCPYLHGYCHALAYQGTTNVPRPAERWESWDALDWHPC